MVEVLTDTFDRAWWRTYAGTLARRSRQEAIQGTPGPYTGGTGTKFGLISALRRRLRWR
jgi:hypothetical protein